LKPEPNLFGQVYALLMLSSPLLGRAEECQTLARMLTEVRQGASRALVIRGEAGMGKTALLEQAVEMATGFSVHRQLGVEPEVDLGYAALQQLLAPFLSGLEELRLPQRNALSAAFGLLTGDAPDKFLVGLATLTLIANAAVCQPVLCVIDDAHWLDKDSADVLGFVSRRLYADRVAVLFAAREAGTTGSSLSGLPELLLDGLSTRDARILVQSVMPQAISPEVVERLVAETRGNPLALIELSLELTPAQRASAQLLPDPLPISGGLSRRFLRQIGELPMEAQRLLLLASAERSRDPGLLWRAAAKLGIDPGAAGPAQAEGLVTFEPTVTFRHPLVRSAAYHAASRSERRAAHRALAETLDPVLDADRRAWHLAAATAGPDEEVAAELARSAERATGRGGYVTAAAFLRRAAELTMSPTQQADRWLAAAEAELNAGEVQNALELLELAAPILDDPMHAARARRLEGAAHFALGDGQQAPATLLAAAEAFVGLDDRVARDTLLQALEAAFYANRAAMLEVARAASKQLGLYGEHSHSQGEHSHSQSKPSHSQSKHSHSQSKHSHSQTVGDILLEGFVELLTSGHAQAAPALRRAVATLASSELRDEELSWFGLGCWAAAEMLDLESGHALASRWAGKCRERGALLGLANALDYLGVYQVTTGEFETAQATAEERRALLSAAGTELPDASTTSLALQAWRGEAEQARRWVANLADEAEALSRGARAAFAHWALLKVELGAGNYELARSYAKKAIEGRFLYVGSVVLPDLVEAAARTDHVDEASAALDALRARADAGGSQFGRGILARSEALLANDTDAERLYEAAIENLGRSGARLHVAQAHLLFGEWLRRRNRRTDAREQLRQAYEFFDAIGAQGYGQRARRELLATGETVRKRNEDTRYELTAQEAQVAKMVSEGATNSEVAAQLFLSPSTVDYHLRKVFRKLGVSSRTQLARRLTPALGDVPHVN
jgi:DNA-binding CsgD family transcriptional regulator